VAEPWNVGPLTLVVVTAEQIANTWLKRVRAGTHTFVYPQLPSSVPPHAVTALHVEGTAIVAGAGAGRLPMPMQHAAEAQSSAQLLQLSPGSHVPSPHDGPHPPQSVAQVEQVSVASQAPLPHDAGHAPQSTAQFEQVSIASHVPLPHDSGHAPQSAAQVSQDSPASQVPFPHDGGHAPQSTAQDEHVSPASQAPSPHDGPPFGSGSPPPPPEQAATKSVTRSAATRARNGGRCARPMLPPSRAGTPRVFHSPIFNAQINPIRRDMSTFREPGPRWDSDPRFARRAGAPPQTAPVAERRHLVRSQRQRNSLAPPHAETLPALLFVK
jgi:hypothetical protein